MFGGIISREKSDTDLVMDLLIFLWFTLNLVRRTPAKWHISRTLNQTCLWILYKLLNDILSRVCYNTIHNIIARMKNNVLHVLSCQLVSSWLQNKKWKNCIEKNSLLSLFTKEKSKLIFKALMSDLINCITCWQSHTQWCWLSSRLSHGKKVTINLF